MGHHHSWGQYPRVKQKILHASWTQDPLPKPADGSSLLPHGLGRSYGDSCLNGDAHVVLTRGLNRVLQFDRENGLLRCEAGVSLEEILALTVPHGWFLPVSPGTQFVTAGGAAANDIHGKNHHRAGCFGHHVTRFELLRSDGQRLLCSPKQHADWFRATIGGLGLTGLITWLEIKLKAVHNPWIEAEILPMKNLDCFFRFTQEADQQYEYTVAWIDSLAGGKNLGRGLFFRGNHAPAGSRGPRAPGRLLGVPFHAPNWLLNRFSIGVFNRLYGWLQARSRHLTHYQKFFYPLDRVHHWNRLWGRRGFLQYQCVVPGSETMNAILKYCAANGLASFLSVLKKFGAQVPAGLLSFPREGLTLTLDLPVTTRILRHLDALDRMVAGNGGAVYPAKDARMNAAHFQRFFPHWRQLEPFIDPQFSSSFWRRVSASAHNQAGKEQTS